MKIHASSAPSPARRAKSSALLSFLAGAFLATSSAFATPTEILNEPLRDGSLPAGWSQTDLVFETGAGGYARMTSTDSLLTSPEFDGTAYDTVTVNFDVAKWGGGGDGPVTLEVSLDGGENWDPVGDSPTPTGTTYLSASLTIETLSDEMVLRFNRANSPSQKRLRDVVVLGNPPVIEPVLSAVTVGTIGFSSAEVEAEVLDEGASAVTDRGFVIAEQAVDPEPELGESGVTSVAVGDGPGVFDTTLGSLLPETTYAVRAYATNGEGTSYSAVALFTTNDTLPVVSAVDVSNITNDSADVEAEVLDEGAFLVIERGFVFSKQAVDPEPELGEPGVTSVVVGAGAGVFGTTLTGLDPGTFYAVRAFATNGDGTSYSAVETFLVPLPTPEITSIGVAGGYTQDFATFVSEDTLPTGWSLERAVGSPLYSDYGGEFGEGTAPGTRGEGVFGYQHTQSTGVVRQILTIVNNTGGPIDEVYVSYTGRVERVGEGRSPAYSVEANEVPESPLSYSTASGVDEFRATSSFFFFDPIPDGESFTIEWESERGDGTGSSRQIGISDVVVYAPAPGEAWPPVVSTAQAVDLSSESTELAAEVLFDGLTLDPLFAKGFVFAEASVNDNPELGGPGVTDAPDTFGFGTQIATLVEGLSPGTTYAVRAYAENGVGLSYSPVTTFTTLDFPPLFAGDIYQQDFSTFVSLETLPDGWEISSTTTVPPYTGPFGSGTSGIRGEGTFGIQHTSTSGTVTQSLTLTNSTGETIDSLLVGYRGRVARETQQRSPGYTVLVDGIEVPGLAYTTLNRVDEDRAVLVSGLSIAPGEPFTIEWLSDRGEPAQSSKQIGLTNVWIQAAPATAPVEISPGTTRELFDPVVVTLTSGTAGAEIYYTLDGTLPDPDAESGPTMLYDEPFEVSDTTTVRAIAVESELGETPPVSAYFEFFGQPVVDVATVADLRGGATDGTVYRLTGEAVVTYVTPGFRNQHWIQDGTAGILLDDNTNVLQTSYFDGDGVVGLIGTLTTFQGMLRFVPAVSGPDVNSVGNSPAPLLLTMAQLIADPTAYQARLVRVNNVGFTDTGTFANGSEHPITNQANLSQEFTFRSFFGADYIGEELYEDAFDLVGLIETRTSGTTIQARATSDFLFPATQPLPGGSFSTWIAGFNVGIEDGFLDNPAGDGIANGLKHLLGLNPEEFFAGALLTETTSDGSSITFQHTLIKESERADDVLALYEWSTDLATWTKDGEELDGITVSFSAPDLVDDSHPDFDLVEVTATVSGGELDALFVRLGAELEMPE